MKKTYIIPAIKLVAIGTILPMAGSMTIYKTSRIHDQGDILSNGFQGGLIEDDTESEE